MSIKNYLNKPIVYNYDKLSLKDLDDAIEKAQKESQLLWEKEQKRLKDSFKELAEKSKKFNEEVPIEVQVIVFSNRVIGMKLYEKYKKWFE